MKRLILSTKALWHVWRAYCLTAQANRLMAVADRFIGKAEHHSAAAMVDLLASRSLATGTSEPSRRSTFNDPATWLLATLTGIFIAGVWLLIVAMGGSR
ncbi:hypothetical protein [Mesorhizobium sp. BE184]|uniref:hypothetical protein n=1 Tax=Mesorhizobium sp. BE184 TaxID=2817714 RepID=UPI002864549E|nr:hypothetical protein [Mesorhizobium sp. BE184]MDR7034526.1 hypothetical protein [Mesorhizobium sp. BE184]